ncbi:MAG: formimidoylglutamate deiminase [Inquilinus sp.]|nr:formimidoylglutamate deiminase [Inquilinus sp.]
MRYRSVSLSLRDSTGKDSIALTAYLAPLALLPDGWAKRVRIEVDADGAIAKIWPGGDTSGAEALSGPVLPGMPNLHSHAFQRAMAGLAERADGGDDFWGWRQVIYRFLDRMGPDEMEAVAAQLYVEMLKAGYTAVAEFHYLHHAPGGSPYADPAELSRQVVAAATRAGIGLTHLPVLYARGGFDDSPLAENQRRFAGDPDRLLAIVAALARDHGDDPNIHFGVAPHSLRAVAPDMLAALVAGAHGADPMAPIHIHVAEQTREVEDCLARTGARPVEWLLSEAPLDGRWCLVHATHMNSAETRALAASDAVAGLCPTTEANLGDGLFPLADFLQAGGKLGIGSDSHVSVSPIEELRWLDYGQRLTRRRRAVAADEAMPSPGERLFRLALQGGAQALGRPVGRLEAGCRADLLVLDGDSPTLAGRSADRLLDTLVFAGNLNPVRDVMVGGRWVVREGRHTKESAILDGYRRALATLTA